MVTSTGRIVPSWLCVRALNSLQNDMMLMPCGPRAVPTGGAGFARPAGIWSLTNPVAFFAMCTPVRSYRADRDPGPERAAIKGQRCDSHGVFHVVVVPDGALLAAQRLPRARAFTIGDREQGPRGPARPAPGLSTPSAASSPTPRSWDGRTDSH